MHAWSASPPSRGLLRCFVSLRLAHKPAAERTTALVLLHVLLQNCCRVSASVAPARCWQQWRAGDDSKLADVADVAAAG